MKSFDWWGLVSFLLISFAFYTIRKRIFLYIIFCVAIIGSFVLFTRGAFEQAGRPPEWFILIGGLALYAFGLLIVRIMLSRSVSLHLLARLTGGQNPENVEDEIANRLRDMLHYRLVAVDGNQVYTLTNFGRVIAWIVTVTYTVLRIAK
jgi:hypothetical protein